MNSSPQNSSPDAEFAQHLAQGRFMLQRSKQSGQCYFYPRVAEPGTGCTDYEWVTANGLGTVYSVTVVSQKPPTPNYNLVLVDLDEGPRMMSRVEGIAPEAVHIGMRVRAKIGRGEGEYDAPLVVFEPAQ